jgi:nicotinamidase/pyrazinamidase
VRATALDAAASGFETYVIREGVRAVGGSDATRNTFEEFCRAGLRVVGVNDYVVQQMLDS